VSEQLYPKSFYHITLTDELDGKIGNKNITW